MTPIPRSDDQVSEIGPSCGLTRREVRKEYRKKKDGSNVYLWKVVTTVNPKIVSTKLCKPPATGSYTVVEDGPSSESVQYFNESGGATVCSGTPEACEPEAPPAPNCLEYP